MNPFNKTNDMPKDPMMKMGTEMDKMYMKHEDMMSSMEMTKNNTPMNPSSVSNVKPGGRPQTQEGNAVGDKMQYSEEGGRMYKGSMAYSKNIKMFT